MKKKSTLLAQSSQKSDSLYLFCVILFKQMQVTSLKSFQSPYNFSSQYSAPFFLYMILFLYL